MTIASSVQLDMLNEVGNIGAGNAATSLSILMDRKVIMHLPWTRVCSIEEGCSILSRVGEVGICVEVRVEGNLSGTMLLTLTEDSAAHIISSFGTMLEGKTLVDDLAQSALMEVGNIVTGSFITAISNFVGETGMSTPPILLYDYFDAFICNTVIARTEGSDVVLVFKTELEVDGKAIFGDLAFLPSPEAFRAITKKLDVAEGMVEGNG
ncbi:MAG: chemotaxis protein CheC [Peptococcaceae bacterium]|nr:chemotaxis protein CheC [Peptococcaceae bacterium]